MVRKSLRKLVIDSTLNVNPVGTDARLTGASEFTIDCSRNSLLKVCIVENNKRCVAYKAVNINGIRLV